MKSLKKKKENKVLGSTTTTYGGTVIYDSADKSIIVTPDRAIDKPIVTETRVCKRETYSDGTITSVPVGWHKTYSDVICETPHGKLVKTKDDFLRVYMGTKFADKAGFPDIIRREAEIMAKALENY